MARKVLSTRSRIPELLFALVVLLWVACGVYVMLFALAVSLFGKQNLVDVLGSYIFGFADNFAKIASYAFVVPAAIALAPIICLAIYWFIIEPGIVDRWKEFCPLWARLNNRRFKQWLIRQVTILREIGFYEREKGKTTEEFSEEVLCSISRNPKQRLGMFVRYPSMLIERKTKRVWCDSLECDAYLDAEEYATIIEEWAAITNGVFQPKNLRAERRDEHISVYFDYNDQQYELSVEDSGEWLDFDLYSRLNKIIRESGYLFAAPKYPDDATGLLMFLTPESKQRLEREGSWRFEQ